MRGRQQRLNPKSFRMLSSVLGRVLITVLQAASGSLLGASMLVAGAGFVGANPAAVSRVWVAPEGFCHF